MAIQNGYIFYFIMRKLAAHFHTTFYNRFLCTSFIFRCYSKNLLVIHFAPRIWQQLEQLLLSILHFNDSVFD